MLQWASAKLAKFERPVWEKPEEIPWDFQGTPRGFCLLGVSQVV